MQESIEGREPAWADRPLNIHDLLEAARANILGSNPSVPVSSLTRSEVGFVNTILEHHARVSIEREHTGYRHVRTCRQVPPITPIARTALRRAQDALENGSSPEEAHELARGYLESRTGLDIDPLAPGLPLRLDEATLNLADQRNAARSREDGVERIDGPTQQWTVHSLAIQVAPSKPPPVRTPTLYDQLPDGAWARKRQHR